MAKEIILYNLRDDVTDEDYKKWCEEYKGPVLLGLDSVKRFTLVNMLGGIKGNGKESIPPEETKPPFKYVGILVAQAWKTGTRTEIRKHSRRNFSPSGFPSGWRISMFWPGWKFSRGKVTSNGVDPRYC